MIVRSLGTVQALTAPPQNPAWTHRGSMRLFEGLSRTYAQIYATQPNVRTVVDFLSRNIAELTPHAFRRISDTDRQRLAGHPLERTLKRPNPRMTGYRLFEETMGDLGVYHNAFWLKLRAPGTFGLAPLPADQMQIEGGLFPSKFVLVLPNGDEREFDPSEIVHFRSYNPCDRGVGLTPLETLRRILAEEAAAGAYREGFWRNSARIEGVIQRPREAGKWTTPQREQFRQQWNDKFTGAGNAGKIPVLEDGMTFQSTNATAKEAEYLGARKLTREECAAAYHVPLPLVGILDHATFSNIKEQHKHLYQDCLGPWLKMLVSEIELHVVPEFDDVEDVYVEFNIAAKLAGTPEEQTASLVQAVGKPIMTVNEARARVNLPRDDAPESDRIAPQQGGPSDASVNPENTPPARTDDDEPDDDDVDARTAGVLQATRRRQQSRLARLPIADRPAAFTADLDRWNRELADDLQRATGRRLEPRAAAANAAFLRQLEIDAVTARVAALEGAPAAK